jgi:two-component system CheB/CheR fusion protein
MSDLTRSQPANDQGLELLLDHLKRIRAFDFSGYKRATLARRIEKRMQQVGIASHEDYIDYLEVHPDEFEPLFNTILINVTSFFRDADVWDALRSEVIPQLAAAQRASGRPIRVWSAGCASGQEAYSAVMLLADELGTDGLKDRIKVYATDVDNDALDHARRATYSDRELESLPSHYAERYMELNDRDLTVVGDLRRAVIFGRHDLLQDAPISRIDLLLCRNTVMYFNADVQAQLLGRLHFSLADAGILVLGKVETLLARNEMFEAVQPRQRMFRKVPRGSLHNGLLALGVPSPHRLIGDGATDQRVLDSAFEHAPSAQLLLDRRGITLAANAKAREMFDLPVDCHGRPFQDLELSYRPTELRSSIDVARAEARTVSLKAVKRWTHDGAGYLDIDVVPLSLDGEHIGLVLSFADVTSHHEVQDELQRTHRELATAYEELQSANEELQTTNEELQSTVEELETTNEELQSTNEELETMNEELASSNEELQAMNDELRHRTAELNQVNAYMESILVSLQASVIVVDRDLHARVWNGRSFEMWGLRADEVEGRSILGLDIGFPVEALASQLRGCLTGELSDGAVVVDAYTRRGQPIQCRARISPLRGSNRDIEGAIILIEEVPDSSPDRV